MNIESVKLTMDLLYQKFLIPMILFDEEGKLIYPEGSEELEDSVKKHITFKKSERIQLYNMKTYLYGHFSFQAEQKNFHMIVGPCGVIGSKETSCFFMGHEYHYDIHYSKEDKYSFEEYVQLLYTILTQKATTKEDFLWSFQQSEDRKNLHTDHSFENNIYDRRVHKETFDSYHFELRYLDYIKRNEPEKVIWIFNKMKETYKVALSPFELEGLKLKFAAFVAIVTRMSIEEGVPINQAFGLSDSLIQGLVHIHSANECLQYMKEATYRFMDLLHSYPLAEKSLLVKTIVNHIDNHLYERITIDELAAITEKHKNHLCSHFKKEMGTTVHRYIQEKKISEAKHLLLFTDHSYDEISNLLAFSSQSHFIQSFKKITGYTPKEYKSIHYAHSLI
ncbi:transcriptional regulator [Enterococcus villorum]|uniref:Transcriptional regulator n=1 Tax=Enterococcus villorum TaxID=112904 RepID=A0A1V8YG22_9ENTE|nr:AraC family transcriptional regulator [Enterococcus villorum]OQO71565.1 transcriptional regulator [Enterococcus villorum]OQO73677.1 transcriptional regulator [Enterococcus villorum]